MPDPCPDGPADPGLDLVVVGVSHRGAPVAVREALAFDLKTLSAELVRLRAEAALAEVLVLSTCNRVEVYTSGGAEAAARVGALLDRRAARPVAGMSYVRTGADAVRHAFRVAAGLDSMVLGETQVLGQWKAAWEAADVAGTVGAGLNALRARSLSTAKRVRTDTGIGRHAVSVSHVAVELARKIFGALAGRPVALVGAGKMSRLAAVRLVDEGARASVVGRTAARAEELAAALGGRALPWEALGDQLAEADIVISGTAAPGIVITREDVERAAARRRGRPLFLIDIAVPRDVEPDARHVPGVFLYDMDDLSVVCESNLRERAREAVAAEALVDREVRSYVEWRRAQRALPMLTAMRRHAEEVRREELDRARRRPGGLTTEQERMLDEVTQAIVNKLLHAPTVHLKALARDGQAEEHQAMLKAVLGIP